MVKMRFNTSFLISLAYASSLCVGCGPSKTSWEDEECAMSGIGKVNYPKTGSDLSANWKGCRAFVNEHSDTLQVQFMTANTQGSFLQPGIGWLDITLRRSESPGTLMAVFDENVDIEPGRARAVYVTPGNVETPGMGTLVLEGVSLTNDSFEISISSSASSLKFDTNQSNDGVLGLECSISAASASPAKEGEQDPDNLSCNMSACAAYQGQCGSTTSQAPCYCAAACYCSCSNDRCETQNRAAAQQLGTTCSY